VVKDSFLLFIFRKASFMKRRIKKQLKEDEFVSGMTKFLEFAKKWQKELIIAGVALLAIALLFVGFQLLKAQQMRNDSRTIGEILKLRSSLAENPQDIAKLEELGGQGRLARVAYVSLATYWIEQGEFDKAQADLDRIRDGTRDFFYYQARDLEAMVAVFKGNYDRAIDILKKIEEEKPEDYLLDAVYFHHAEALEKKGNLPEALALYKKIQDEYGQGYYGYDASLRVKKLEGGSAAGHL
jgi:predicted negative regulator of RcsB-dependent stress response